MIQRIQTLFMLVAGIIAGLLFRIPFARSIEYKEGMAANGTLESPDHIAMIIVNALAIALTLISIFLFRNRKVQLRINAINMLLLLLLPILGYIFLRMEQGEGPMLALMPGAFFPALAILLLVFANRSIRKDEKLVRSADRLR